jgi:Fe-S oxidoreductase
VANIEVMAPFMSKVPRLVNFFLRQSWLAALIKKTIGYVDTPLLSYPTLNEYIAELGAEPFDLSRLVGLDSEQRARYLLIVQDPFTSYYEAEVIRDLVLLVRKLGYEPIVLPFKPNGKPQHVKGFLAEFALTARNSAEFLNKLSALDIPMVGVDPSLVLCYRDEYKKALGETRGDFNVLLVHEWLQSITVPATEDCGQKEYAFLAHCSEKTALPKSEEQWQLIYANMGLKLKPLSVGCCGMAGTFGHEASHLNESIGIYKLSWQQAVASYQPTQIVATGYSCRSQVARFEGFKPKHPLQVLLQHIS